MNGTVISWSLFAMSQTENHRFVFPVLAAISTINEPRTVSTVSVVMKVFRSPRQVLIGSYWSIYRPPRTTYVQTLIDTSKLIGENDLCKLEARTF